MASTNQVNTVTTENVVPVGATYDANGNFITLVGAAGAPISFSGGSGSFTTLSASSTVTLSGGTANGVAYLNGSKVLTTGSALTFDGTNLGIGTSLPATRLNVTGGSLATSGAGILAAGSLTAGRLVSDGANATINPIHTYFDDRAYEISAGSTSGFVSGVVVAARSFTGTGGEGVSFWTRNVERARIDGSGNLQVPAMYATTVTTPRNVFIDSSGNMGGISSVRASKTNITALDTANWIYQLNPVTFNYRKKDEEGAFLDEFEEEQQFGLIAEDVETVKPELCIYVDDKLQGVHYDRMIAPLIKAIQEQQAIIQSLTDRIAQLEAK